MRLILTTLILVGLIWADESMGWKNTDVLENSGKGVINWSQGTIQATYQPSNNAGSNNHIRPFSGNQNTFKTELIDNIFSTVQSLRIDDSIYVGDFIATTEAYISKIRDLVDDAQIVLRTDTKDHITRATARIPIYGGFAQLVLPQNIKQVQTIKLMMPVQERTKEQKKNSKTDDIGIARPYTGLIVDARNIDAIPALVPIIYDESGNEVYGPAFVSREFAVQYGLAGYTRSLKVAFDHIRVTDNPLMVKGLHLHPSGPCNIVISNADARRIRSTYDHLSFLRTCHVIIVID
ncbi:MAG: hypothetical protein PVI90_18325 [Desulfobacteraceae bacterium]|jgi:hypothetical protein